MRRPLDIRDRTVNDAVALVLSPFAALSLLTVINRRREAYCKEGALGTKLIDLQPKDTDPEDRH